MIEQILQERAKTHGDFKIQSASTDDEACRGDR